MVISLHFWAVSEADARRQATEWAAAEPNVESCQIVSAWKSSPHSERWAVSVQLVLRSGQQEELGLPA